MARKKFWLGSVGPLFYDPDKTRADGSPHAVEFEEAPVIGDSTAATESYVDGAISGYAGTVTLPSTNPGKVFDLSFFKGLLITATERDL